MVKRCGVRGWTCGRVCGRELACGIHTCEQRCHKGQTYVTFSIHVFLHCVIITIDYTHLKGGHFSNRDTSSGPNSVEVCNRDTS